jgi:hypothetical protein
VVTKDIVVPEGATLIINRGVTVRFAAGASLIVHGTLRVSGDAEDMARLTFTAPGSEAGYWGGIEARGPESRVNLNWLIIDHCENAAKFLESTVDIANCTIREAQNEGIYAANNTKLRIINSCLSGCETAAKMEGNSSGTLALNMIYNNNSKTNAAILTSNSNMTITDNIIMNGEKGVQIEFEGTHQIRYNYFYRLDNALSIVAYPIIESNTFVTTGTGIEVFSESIPQINSNNFKSAGSHRLFRVKRNV